MSNQRRQFLKSAMAGVAALSTAGFGKGHAASAKKPNILFITIDDLNSWITGKQRHPLVQCKNIDKLMSRSVNFTNAHCAAPGFMPELVISKEVKAHGRGYAAEKFYPFPVKNPIVDTLGHKVGQSLVAGPVDRETNMFDKKMPDELVADWLVEHLENHQSNTPFFMAGGFLRPHVPFTAPQEYFDAIDINKIQLPTVDDMTDIPDYGKAMALGFIPGGDHNAVKELGEDYWKELIQGYLASIAFVDDQVGRVLNALEASGKADNTWIFLTSDHGQNFGEKENWRKMCLWDESTRTPLIICPPDRLERNNLIDKPQFKMIAAKLRVHIPKSPSLPVGMTKWTGDRLDTIVGELRSAI